MKDNIYRTFLLTALVVLVLLSLHLLPPLKIGDTELRRVSVLSDISDSPFDKEQIDVIPKPVEPRTDQTKIIAGKKVSFKEIWPKGVERIVDFSAGKANGMNHFYAMLDSLSRKRQLGRPVRKAYYGDSFIESDILTEYLRDMLQAKYGGGGVGWIDAGNELISYKPTVVCSFSGLKEYMVMKKDGYSPNEASISERYYPASSVASLSLRGGYKECPRTMKWGASRLYLKTKSGCGVTARVNDSIVKSFSLSPSSNVQFVETLMPSTSISYSVNGSGNTLYGAALETDNGIVLDNFSMRGSSGITLSTLNAGMLSDFARIRPYDLIIFQFGTNAITAKTNEKAMEMYMGQMKKVVDLFKRCFPGTSILIVSAPDRGARVNGTIGTMRTLPLLVGYQEQLASQCGVGFYNLFQSMGGEGAMGRLSEKNMCSKDFVHISHKAGKGVAHGVFKSILAGQQNWTRKSRLQIN